MKKTVFSLIFCCMAMGTFAQQPLGGFLYGTEDAPLGTEWEAPEKLSLNKEQPHAYFFSFGDIESALKVLPQHSRFWKDLNGTWKFHWAPNPGERPDHDETAAALRNAAGKMARKRNVQETVTRISQKIQKGIAKFQDDYLVN